MNGIVIARGRRGVPAHALRPAAPARHRLRRRLDPRLPGVDLRRPARAAERVAVHAVEALGLRDGIAFPQLIAHRDGSRRASSRSRRASPAARWPTSSGTRSASTSSRSRCARRSASRSRTRSRCRASSSRSRSASSPRSPARCRPGGDADRQPRARARGRGRRPGRHLPPGRRDDPPGAARRRPARLRDRDRATRPSRRSSAPRLRRGCSTSRSSRRELRASTSRTTASCSRRRRRAATASRTSTASPQPGDLLLRHDVDLSLDAALRMAELEAEARRERDVLPDDESVFYNLASSEGEAAIERLRELGHRVGLHAVYPTRRPRRALRPRRRLAQPGPRVHARADRRRDQRDGGAVLRPGDVPLRLEPALALGLPARGAPRRRVPVAAAPHPSRDLGLSGRRRWARRCARCSTPRSERAARAARGDDRIDLS